MISKIEIQLNNQTCHSKSDNNFFFSDNNESRNTQIVTNGLTKFEADLQE